MKICPASVVVINAISYKLLLLNLMIWFLLQHGTCPVCRRYFCPGELHLPRERVSLFRSIVRRVCRTIRSPLFYFFPSFAYAQAVNDRRRATPMYRLIRAERVTSPQEPAQSASTEMIDDYIFCHVMFVLQNANNEQHPGSPNTIAANMRRRFSRLHREANANPAAGQTPPPQRPEFIAGENPPPQRPEFQAGGNPPAQRPEFREGGNPPLERPEFHFPSDVLSAEYLGHY